MATTNAGITKEDQRLTNTAMKSIVEKKQLLERMHLLIKKGSTGTPSEFAEKLNISKSSLHRHLEAMKIIGAPILYSITRQTYEYEYDVDLHIGFVPLDKQSTREITGGHSWSNMEIFEGFFASVKK